MKHWDSNYDSVWNSEGKQLLSKQETNYISSRVQTYAPKTVLDIGCGTGRILQAYLQEPYVQHIYGVDTSPTMVKHCKERLGAEKKITEIICKNITHENIFTEMQFDMISAIRILKYNQDWHQMISRIVEKLAPGGILICTMPNKHSLTALWKGDIAYTTPQQFRSQLEQSGLRVLDMTGFSKLPDKFHTWAKSKAVANSLQNTEKVLQKILGPLLGTRILFATCQKVV